MDVIAQIWKTIKEEHETNLHIICGKAVENVMKAALASNSMDNITGVLVTFKDFYEKSQSEIKTISPTNYNTAKIKPTEKYIFKHEPVPISKTPIKELLNKKTLEKLVLHKGIFKDPQFVTHDAGEDLASLKNMSGNTRKILTRGNTNILPSVKKEEKKQKITKHRPTKSFELKKFNTISK